jgi:hypothetical protein
MLLVLLAIRVALRREVGPRADEPTTAGLAAV